MFNRLLPRSIDNTYRGHKLALWLFGLIVSLKIFQCLFIIFNAYSVAKSADGIPLDTYPAASAQTIVALFALAAFSRLVVFVLCVLVLVWYRSAVPFMFALLVVDYLAKTLILRFLPIVSTGTPPGPAVNLVLFTLMVVGLALSLWSRDSMPSRAEGTA